VWNIIASDMQQRGWTTTGTQCNTKFKALKKKFKAVKDNNNTSGAHRQTWKYFDVSTAIHSQCMLYENCN